MTAHDFVHRTRSPWRPHHDRRDRTDGPQSIAIAGLMLLGLFVLVLWVIAGGSP